MMAMVTLHHFTNPLWLVEMGGWENEAVVDLFAAYSRRVVQALGSHCNFWITINEPNVLMTGGYVGGDFPPGKKDLKTGLKVLSNLLKGHAAAYQAIHEVQSEAQVGVAHHWRGFLPANKNPFTFHKKNLYDKVFNESFPQALVTGKFDAALLKENVPQAKNTQDFMGLNYYTRELIRFELGKRTEKLSERPFPKDAELSESGTLANDPEGFKACIKWARQFGKPIYITENGVDDSKDDFRRKYLLQHLHAMWHMINHNVPIKGYFHWTLVDNFEWERGWTQKFGLWGLDPATQLRTRRKSADLYSEVCRTNSITSETVEKYCPEVYNRIYPV
jgi:beta-glucosidase